MQQKKWGEGGLIAGYVLSGNIMGWNNILVTLCKNKHKQFEKAKSNQELQLYSTNK